MTKKKPKESLAEIQKQREDLEALLASIEEAYSEGTMPEAQYQEVKSQNDTKLQEINEKMDKLAMEGGGEAPPKEGEKPPETSAEAQPAPEQPPPEKPPAEAETKPTPEPAPSEVQVPAPTEAAPTEQVIEGGEKTQQLTSTTIEMPEEIKEMIQGIKEGKIGGNAELAKKVDNVEVDIEKVKSFVDAMKDERSSYDERIQRISEEVGELRSNMTAAETRLGEVEVMSDESSDIVKNLKPQRLTQEIQARDNDVKGIKSRIEKTEDVISQTLKKVGEIRTLLQGLGSIDNLANMSKDIAKKVILIDDKVKKTERMSDRIDTIFGDLNKRLEEFMFYKAKQQSIDEMTQDLMRNIEELTTKLDAYAEKSDLNTMKDILLSKIEETKAGTTAAAAPLTGAAAEVQKQINELKELDTMLEEQKKMGALNEVEYKKSKDTNTLRMEELINKLAEAQAPQPAAIPAAAPGTPTEPTPATGQPAPVSTEAAAIPPPVESAAPIPEVTPTTIPAEPTPAIPTTETTPTEPVPTKPASAEPTEKKELVKEETPFGEMYKLEEDTKPETPEVKPLESKEPAPTTEPAKEAKPESAPTVEEPKEEEPKEEPEERPEEEITTPIKKGMNKHDRMLIELEESFKKGLLSEKAYSKTKKLLEANNN